MEYPIPEYLNAPVEVLWWESDEALYVAIGAMIGIFFGHPLKGVAAGTLLAALYRVAKHMKQPGFLWHWLYAWGFWSLPGRIPEYWIKEFVR